MGWLRPSVRVHMSPTERCWRGTNREWQTHLQGASLHIFEWATCPLWRDNSIWALKTSGDLLPAAHWSEGNPQRLQGKAQAITLCHWQEEGSCSLNQGATLWSQWVAVLHCQGVEETTPQLCLHGMPPCRHQQSEVVPWWGPWSCIQGATLREGACIHVPWRVNWHQNQEEGQWLHWYRQPSQ